MSKSGTFEWVVGWADLAPYLSPAALDLQDSERSAIDIGCGTSTLPVALLGAGYASVTAVDRDAECVAHMRARHAVAWAAIPEPRVETVSIIIELWHL